MAVTLTDGTTTVELHADAYWADETAWHPVEQTVQRTITGALIVSAGLRIKGRPVTLQSIDENSAWVKRTVVDALRNWAAVVGQQLTLTLNAQTYTVIFRHHEPPALIADPVKFQREVDAEDWFTVVLRLMEV